MKGENYMKRSILFYILLMNLKVIAQPILALTVRDLAPGTKEAIVTVTAIESGSSYTLQTSTNLQSWLDLQTVTAQAAELRLTNTFVTKDPAPIRFFRVKQN